MSKGQIIAPDFEADELKGFSRTVAEIEWLLVLLVLLYQIVQGHDESGAAIYPGLLLFSGFVIGFHYVNIYRVGSRWKIAVETWVMIVFITWILYHSGRIESPLTNLYLLTIVTSALTLGKLITLLEVALIAACYIFLGYASTSDPLFWLHNAGDFMSRIAPMLLVAYITTMLSADIRGALSRIKIISEIDELTGIYNTRAFNVPASRTHKLSLRHRQGYSVIMMDIDNLKKINATHGYESGNRVLKLVVNCVRPQLRETDVFGRREGGTFVILLPQTQSGGAYEVAERIRKSVAATPLDSRGKQVPVSVSLGIAAFPDDGEDLAAIMGHADRALVNSKEQGRNRTSLSSNQ